MNSGQTFQVPGAWRVFNARRELLNQVDGEAGQLKRYRVDE
jgi:hypothetical protein